MKWNQSVLSLKPYQPGKSTDAVRREYGLDEIVKLASNENPFGCSEKVKQALSESASSLAIYPDGYATALREAVAKHTGVKETQLIFGNGSDENIQIISRSLLSEGKNTVMATPTFSQYKHNAVLEHAEIREIPLINGDHDLEGMLAAIDENTAVVWVCTPNNPTGTYIGEKQLREFLEKVPKDVLVVLDEAYAEYVVAEDYPKTNSWPTTYKNLIVLRTFSKAYGLASMRIGYGIADEEVILKLDPARQPFNANTLGQAAAIAAISDQDFIQHCSIENRQGLAQYVSFCESENLFYYPSQTNFILIDFKVDADQLFQHLLEHGYIVRSGKFLGFPTSLRITVGTKEQNEGMIAVLKEFTASQVEVFSKNI
ncbi:histidinol-phosphate transaminase [Peribacillus loiseleuriae]|uniref:Histidinol-phosphate aminotransferase n=1 Tax=Peribacillus loiseleuriae TaxID=1679170 RepID=A0A0K9GWG4_9BACI|nr:histidinol-phosphate transaminase [Peribacillus loiseleuriae]KMY50602.1 histidinol-phosphate aminotransferase [Peribacillus loiseleuriae]